MVIFFWALLSLFFAVTLLGARRMRGVDVSHILYRWQDIMGVSMIGGVICMMLVQFAMI